MAKLNLPSLIDKLSIAGKMQRLRDQLRKPRRRISTGWKELDIFLMGGWVVPSCNILGAPPGAGKSVWAQIVAERHVLRGGYAVYYDFENGEERSLRRLAYRRAKVDPDKEKLTRDEQKRVDLEIAFWSNTPAGKKGGIFMHQEGRKSTPDTFHEEIMTIRHAGPKRPLLIIVDSLQKLFINLDQRRGGLDLWLRQFEETRSVADAVILIISELSRPTQSSKKKAKYIFTGMNYKETGDAEYTVDLALGFDVLDEQNRIVRLISSKTRDGRHLGDVANYKMIEPYQGMQEISIREEEDA